MANPLNVSIIADNVALKCFRWFLQLQVLAERLRINWNKKAVESYSGQDLMIVGQLVCGMNSTVVSQFSARAFLNASAVLSNLDTSCDADVLNGLAKRATLSDVYGAPSTWTEATVSQQRDAHLMMDA